MKSFEYYSPTKILFGNGIRHQIAERIKGRYKKILLVCAKGPFRENGLFGEIKNSLIEADISVYEINDIDSNPRLSSVREGARSCKDNDVECVIALGGGSSMDCAKVIAAAAKTELDPWNFLWGDKVDINKSLDVITIPTIASTGTEVNNFAVIVDDDTKEKAFCQTFFPIIAILDPEIVATVPLVLAIWGAMDILSHTYEFYFNGYSESFMQTKLSESILIATMANIEAMVDDPNDVNARGELLWCAVMAWGGLTKIGRGDPDMACHSIEVCVSGFMDTHHGAALGILTPRWMDIVVEHEPIILARWARNVLGINESNDIKAAKEGVEKYKTWLKKIGAPNTFSDITKKDFTEDDIKHISEVAYRTNNGEIGIIKKFSQQEVEQLLKEGMIPY